MQFGCGQAWSDWADDLGEFFALSQYGDGLNDRDASLGERVATVETLFMLFDSRCEAAFTQGFDQIVRELRPCANFIDGFLELSVEFGLCWPSAVPPPPLVRRTHAVDEFEHTGETFVGKGFVHATTVRRVR